MSPSISSAPRRESEIVAAILDSLKLFPGVRAWRNNTGAVTAEHKGRRRFVRYGFPGGSDIIGWVERNCRCGQKGHVPCDCLFCCDGMPRRAIFLAIEVKRPGGKLSPEQAAFLDDVNRAGGLGFKATSVEDVRARLQPDRVY